MVRQPVKDNTQQHTLVSEFETCSPPYSVPEATVVAVTGGCRQPFDNEEDAGMLYRWMQLREYDSRCLRDVFEQLCDSIDVSLI